MSTTTTAQKSASTAPKRVAISDIKTGDVFSEMSHYTHRGRKDKNTHRFMHHGSQTVVELSSDYVENFLHTANQHSSEIEVGKEDKVWTEKQIKEAIVDKQFTEATAPKVGDVRVPGIRTIWENIHSAHVFQVSFQKQGKDLTAKNLKELRDAQIEAALSVIDKAKTAKKGVAAAAAEAIRNVQENPIIPYEQGEMRVLTGYKTQFTSRDGRYNCVDMEIAAGEMNVRPVNINTITWLIMDGVKYTVKQ